jgi:phosphate acyltransferase
LSPERRVSEVGQERSAAGSRRIAVDAMGGDFAPRTVVDGAVLAARRLATGLTLVGDRAALERELDRHLDRASLDLAIVDAPECVVMDEAPGRALRRKPRASVKVAAQLVASGQAAALFSAGHTGATVMASHAVFGMLPGIDRPALAATLPAQGRGVVLLDSGANVECRPPHLVQFAMMGAAFRNFRRRVDYAEYGGAPLLGVAGVTVVGHGRSSAKAVRSAILMAARLAEAGFIARLKTEAGAGQAS